MTDVHTKERRSYNMSRIRSRDTKPEVRLRKALWREGYRYSLKGKLPGRPDIVLKKYNLAVFVDGCFWHGCPTHFRQPASNRAFWSAKISGNAARDRRNTKQLKDLGWTVLRFWEHDVRKKLPAVVRKIKKAAEKSKA
jgi:DNA mismatch endonuclease (patch repair protein)